MAGRRPGGASAGPGGPGVGLIVLVAAFWAQVTPGSTSTSGGSTGGEAGSVLILSLRRWCGSLTLSPPEAVNGPISAGVWAWLLGLATLLALALALQGPARAIRQVLDVPGHARLLASAFGRVRRSGRLLAAGGWDVGGRLDHQSDLLLQRGAGRDDQLLLTKGRRLVDLALTRGRWRR